MNILKEVYLLMIFLVMSFPLFALTPAPASSPIGDIKLIIVASDTPEYIEE